MDMPEEPSPTGVELDRKVGPHGALARRDRDRRSVWRSCRVNCPCAECRGVRERGEPAWPRTRARRNRSKRPAPSSSAAWGISLRWNDGHETGIYAWGLLRNWAEDPAKE